MQILSCKKKVRSGTNHCTSGENTNPHLLSGRQGDHTFKFIILQHMHFWHDIDKAIQVIQLAEDCVCTLTANGAPVVLVLFNAGPLDISFAKTSSDVHAILEVFFPAQSTGRALYDVMTNSGYDSVPAGRLPATWPTDLNQVSIFNSIECLQK